jgi:trans-2,3-dihydro-3-hydroxyanthranilate isomerase
MTARKFHILNVFTIENHAFSGNPLCVFENGAGLSDQEMQALALQFNLSETTFILPSAEATACIRIFTPTLELPFAGHPTLGSAHVVRELFATGDKVTLETKSGVISLTAEKNQWGFQAPAAKTRPVDTSRAQLAAMLGLEAAEISKPALWVNAGVEQLLIPLNSEAALLRCAPTFSSLTQFGRNQDGMALVYVWAVTGPQQISSRFFFEKSNAVCEDPGTGSACANLGGWLVDRDVEMPVNITVHQGAQTGRNCQLHLRIDESEKIHVSGHVAEFGRGEIAL